MSIDPSFLIQQFSEFNKVLGSIDQRVNDVCERAKRIEAQLIRQNGTLDEHERRLSTVEGVKTGESIRSGWRQYTGYLGQIFLLILAALLGGFGGRLIP